MEEKSAACRQLARVATKESVPALASLLGDEKLSHMARYALETIPDPLVDDALRDALGKVHGRPRLGVIGSLGAGRDAKAVDALAGLLRGDDADAALAAARALGNIGTFAAAKALEDALPGALRSKLLAVGEGLLRCAEALSGQGQGAQSRAIYDRLRGLTQAPAQLRAASIRARSSLAGRPAFPCWRKPFVVRTTPSPPPPCAAMELPGTEVTEALLRELPKAPSPRRGLLILAVADRGDARALPAVLQAAQSGDGQLRILALRALKRVGDASCFPTLLDVAVEGDGDVSQAAMEAIEFLQDKAVNDQVATRLSHAKGRTRRALMELARRRHVAAAAPALWLAADDKDPAVRAAALAGLAP